MPKKNEYIIRVGDYRLHVLTEKHLEQKHLAVIYGNFLKSKRWKKPPASGDDYISLPVLDDIDYLP